MRGSGFDRDDPQAERGHRPRQLPRTRAELDHECRVLGNEPARYLDRPLGPGEVVLLRVSAERQPARRPSQERTCVSERGSIVAITGNNRVMASVLQTERPRLVFFFSPQSGRCRRVEGFIAQVLQRRRNHDTFELVLVPVDEWPELAEKFGIDEVPTICVVEDRKLRKRIVAPRGCRELELALDAWLR